MKKTEMIILITGADGFIGGYLCKRLSKSKANQVIGLTRRGASPKTVLGAHPNCKWHKADLSEGLSMPDDIDIIVHAAARSPGPEVTIADYVSDNIVATKNLIDFAIQKQVRLFIYLSAISIYGRIESATVDEETPVNGFTPYDMTKYLAELLLKEKKDALSSVIFRLPVVVGAGMKSGWLFETYETLLKGERLRIYNGDSPYNMVHISDVCDLVSSSLNYNPNASSVFTIGCKDFMSIRQIVNTMRQYAQSMSEISEEFTADKGFIISTEKVRLIIGFRPTSANEILTKFLEETSASNRRGMEY